MTLNTLEYASPVIHIGVVVADLDASLAFYQNVLGMKKSGEYFVPADFARESGLTSGPAILIEILKLDDSEHATELKLMSFAHNVARPPRSHVNEGLGIQYITLLVKSLHPFVERFNSLGITIPGGKPSELEEGLYFALVRDPDGNFIEVIGPWNE